MTVEATLPVISYEYLGPGNYDFSFKTFHASDIIVTGIKDEIESYWEYLTDYTVTLGTNGGTVTTTRDSVDADKIRITRIMPIQQPVDWVNGGPFDMDLLERNLDQIVMLIQQIQTELNLATITNWRGEWQPDIDYSVRDLVDYHSSIYFCLYSHTSSSDFQDDLDAGYWQIFIENPDIGDIEDLVEQAEDAAARAENSASAAESFATTAIQAAVDADQAAQNSADSAAKSYEWAENPEDVEVEPGEYSAYHWAQKASVFNPDEYYKKSDHIDSSTGAADAGKPIVLNGSGKVDPSMLDVGGFSYIGPFTPTAGAEYPDTTGLDPGAFWDIVGVDDAAGYTYTEGDLTGQTVYNGDYLLHGDQAWSIIEQTNFDPTLYYKLDGTMAITAPFAGGNQQYHNMAAGTEDAHGVNLGQLNAAVSPKADTAYVDSQDAALQTNIDAKADTTYVDSQDAVLQTNIDAKADITYVDSAVSPKADTTYVDSQDAAISDKLDKLDLFTLTATGAIADTPDENFIQDPDLYYAVREMNTANPPAGLDGFFIVNYPLATPGNAVQIGVQHTASNLAYRGCNSAAWGGWQIVPRMRIDGDTLYIRDDGQDP